MRQEHEKKEKRLNARNTQHQDLALAHDNAIFALEPA